MWKETFLQYLRDSTLQISYLQEAISLKHQHLPKTIYKYRGDNSYSRDNLFNDTIWLASPESYNDPFDCLLSFSAAGMSAAFEKGLIDPFVTGYHLEISPEKVNEAKLSARPLETLSQNITSDGKPGQNPRQIAEFISRTAPKHIQTTVDFLQTLRSNMKLCSFSTVPDSILMWSHYSSNHQGFCIEYDIRKFAPRDAFLKNLCPVVYSKDVFDLTTWAEALVTGKREEFNGLFPFLAVLQKFEGWAYENEWRYLQFQDALNPDRARGVPTPSRVLLGAKMPESNKSELLEICQAKKISVWQMHVSYSKYELQELPLSP